jgi:UDP-glucose 4-epimerase
MKILVTGGAGFIGTNLIAKLLKEGCSDITSIDDYSLGFLHNHIDDKRVVYKIEDISKLDYKNYLNFDKVFHLAALSRIQPSFNKPSQTFEANVLGTQKVCEIVRNSNAKMVYAGSSSRWHDPSQSPYAFTKHLGEEICKLYRNTYGCDIEIARFYNVYGPKEILDSDYAAVIGIWRNQINTSKDITIVGDGEQRRDFTHVDDIVDGLWRIAFKTFKHKDAWELGTGVNYSINEVFDMFKNRFPDIKFVSLPDQPGNYRETMRVNNDAIDKLGWKPSNRLYNYIKEL